MGSTDSQIGFEQNRSGVSVDPYYGPPPPRPPAPIYRPPARRVSSAPSGRYSAPAPPPPPPPPPPPTIEQYLGGDTGYQQQIRDFGQSLSDFLADAARRRNNLETNFGSSQKAMGDQKVIDLQNMEADYGARGLLRSGLYGKATGDYNTE